MLSRKKRKEIDPKLVQLENLANVSTMTVKELDHSPIGPFHTKKHPALSEVHRFLTNQLKQLK
jgi:hypothetical protein